MDADERRQRDLTRTSWYAMKRRCLNSDDAGYDNYGGRDIHVCERWLSFENFIEDMGPRPTQAHSIERIDNNGHYEPGNCIWIPRGEQARNRRKPRIPNSTGVNIITEWAMSEDMIDRIADWLMNTMDGDNGNPDIARLNAENLLDLIGEPPDAMIQAGKRLGDDAEVVDIWAAMVNAAIDITPADIENAKRRKAADGGPYVAFQGTPKP